MGSPVEALLVIHLLGPSLAKLTFTFLWPARAAALAVLGPITLRALRLFFLAIIAVLHKLFSLRFRCP